MPRPPIALRSKLAPLLVRPHRSPPAGAPSAWPARPHRTARLHAPRPRRPPGPPARLHRSPTRAPAPPSAPSALCRLPTPAPARHGPPARPPAPLDSLRRGPAVRSGARFALLGAVPARNGSAARPPARLASQHPCPAVRLARPPARTACLHAPRPRRPPGPPARLHRSPTRAPVPLSAPSALCCLPGTCPKTHNTVTTNT
jgi:hypothetical protein